MQSEWELKNDEKSNHAPDAYMMILAENIKS
jgi:hypothetical protein